MRRPNLRLDEKCELRERPLTRLRGCNTVYAATAFATAGSDHAELSNGNE
jgi:hypothetical protein